MLKCYGAAATREKGRRCIGDGIEVIRAYLHGHEAEEVREQLETGAAAIAKMVPHVIEHLVDLPELRAMEYPVSARFRMFDSTTTFLKNATSARPMVIVLDDLHWADGSSLLLVEFIAHRLAEMKLLPAVCHKPEDIIVPFAHHVDLT